MDQLPPLPLAGLLRHELDEYVATLGRRRTVPTVVHVGRLGGARVTVAADDVGEDPGWRADLVERALEGAEHPQRAWLTRAGELDPRDDDHAWCAAAGVAFARHGLELPGFHVLTRYGWRDLVSGEAVTFHRIRRRG